MSLYGPTSYLAQGSSMPIEHQKRLVEATIRTQRKTMGDRLLQNETDFTEQMKVIINSDFEVTLKYKHIPAKDLLRNNFKGQDNVPNMDGSLTILEKYGKNLLKPLERRPPMWKAVMFGNGVFRERVQPLEGCETILKLYGYVHDLDGDGLAFPEGVEPEKQRVKDVITDILLLREEIRLYSESYHPFREQLEQFIPLQEARIKPKVMSPEIYISNQSNQIRYPPTADEHRGPPRFSQPVLEKGSEDSTPSGGPSKKMPPKPSPKPDNVKMQEIKKPVVFPPKNEAGDPPMCDICGNLSAEWSCPGCNNGHLLCTECDKKWHQHPKRTSHERDALYPNITEENLSEMQTSQDGAFMVIPSKKSTAPKDSAKLPVKITGIQESGSGDSKNRNSSPQRDHVSNLPQTVEEYSSVDEDQSTRGRSTSVKVPKQNPFSPLSLVNDRTVEDLVDNLKKGIKSLKDIGAQLVRIDVCIQELESKKNELDAKVQEILTTCWEFTVDENYRNLTRQRDKYKKGILELQKYKEDLEINIDREKNNESIGYRPSLHISENVAQTPPKKTIERCSNPKCLKDLPVSKNFKFCPECGHPTDAMVPRENIVRPKHTAVGPEPSIPKHDDEKSEGERNQESMQATRRKVKQGNKWSCKECTFLNNLDKQQCEMCLVGKMADSVPPEGTSVDPPIVRDQGAAAGPSVAQPGPSTSGEGKTLQRRKIHQWVCRRCTTHNSLSRTSCTACMGENKRADIVEEEIEEEVVGKPHFVKKEQLEFPSIAESARQMAREKEEARREYEEEQENIAKGKKNEPDLHKHIIQKAARREPDDLSDFDTIAQLEEKRKAREIISQGRIVTQLIRAAEHVGYSPEAFNIGMENCENIEKVVDWLDANWKPNIEKVKKRCNAMCAKNKEIGNMTTKEATDSLIQCNGDVESAVNECASKRMQKVKKLKNELHLTTDEILNVITNTDGDLPEAQEFHTTRVFKKIAEKHWDQMPEKESEFLRTSFADNAILDQGYCYTVQNQDEDKDRRIRMILAELDSKLAVWIRAENVIQVIDEDLGNLEATVQDVIDASANTRGHVRGIREWLSQQCDICFDNVTMNKMRVLAVCQCKICENCMQTWFETMVKNDHVRKLVCPGCQRPDLDDKEMADHHFEILSALIRELTDKDTYDLFHEKLRDWNLMQEPAFRWCSNGECRGGVIFPPGLTGRLMMNCPTCHSKTCFKCKKPWETQHNGITCDAFQEWKEANDPEYQAQGLKKHLEENGIDCPQCNFRYALAKGGCMHFKCTQCRAEFCSGCYKPFKQGSNCKVDPSCAGAGLHCHHPRDCLFYLRDYSLADLQGLLQKSNIEFSTDPPGDWNQGEGCGVLEQRETPEGLKDESCGKGVAPNQCGLCMLHYREYLVELINKNLIDPVEILEPNRMKVILQKDRKAVPEQGNMNEEQFKQALIRVVREQLPLPKKPPRKRVQTQ